MTARQVQVPGGPYFNDDDEATLYQRQVPDGPFVNETSQSSGITFTQEGFRWRYDDGDQVGATFSAAQDEPSAASIGLTKRLRVIVDVTGNPGSPAAEQFQLQYRRTGSPTEEWKKVY
jgi:hypothetical protein